MMLACRVICTMRFKKNLMLECLSSLKTFSIGNFEINHVLLLLLPDII